jgi:hypothetical protein
MLLEVFSHCDLSSEILRLGLQLVEMTSPRRDCIIILEMRIGWRAWHWWLSRSCEGLAILTAVTTVRFLTILHMPPLLRGRSILRFGCLLMHKPWSLGALNYYWILQTTFTRWRRRQLLLLAVKMRMTTVIQALSITVFGAPGRESVRDSAILDRGWSDTYPVVRVGVKRCAISAEWTVWLCRWASTTINNQKKKFLKEL